MVQDPTFWESTDPDLKFELLTYYMYLKVWITETPVLTSFCTLTGCPGDGDPLCIVSRYMRWVAASWTYSIYSLYQLLPKNKF